jgi:hypothetical protein
MDAQMRGHGGRINPLRVHDGYRLMVDFCIAFCSTMEHEEVAEMPFQAVVKAFL